MNNNINKRMADILYSKRTEHNLSCEKLAKKMKDLGIANYPRQALHEYERNKLRITIEYLYVFCKTLDIPMATLMQEIDV